MQIILGKNGGFCFGVKRAIDAAEKLQGENNYILGEIIHNESVNQKLCDNGIKRIDKIEDAPFGSTVLIRTHGEKKAVFDKAKSLGINIIDCTCPFVKDIQKIVDKYNRLGYQIIIIGDKNHPEVDGINGWCENRAIITSENIDFSLVKSEKICIVAQTTFSLSKFEEIFKNIHKEYSKIVEIFKTICYTTTRRQTEAEEISRNCDAVIVLGGNNSNNTNKLYEICRANNHNVFRAVSPQNLDYKKIINFSKVGIVLGASTPDTQSQEVIHNMENITEVKASETEEVVTTSNQETAETVTVETAVEATQEIVNEPVIETATEEVAAVNAVEEPKQEIVEPVNENSMQAAFDKIDNKPAKFRPGQTIEVTISKVAADGLDVYIPNTKKEIKLLTEELINTDLASYESKIGDEIRVMITEVNPVKISEKAMINLIKEEAEIEEIRNGKLFQVTVTASNKGGLTGKFGSYQVFIPSSQIRIGFVKELDKYVGKTLRCKAEKIENTGRKQIVASQRVVLEVEKAERDAIRLEKEEFFFNNIEIGDVVKGTTQRFSDFGAFVQVNGFDCLAHISDLCWSGCKKCSDVLELNKEYEFKILKIDKENKKVSIGYKQLQPKPWDLVLEKYAVGDVITGKVVRIVSFGAFVEVEKEIDGLVHVSQISYEWLENPTSVLKVGEEVQVKILEIDPEKEKMTLSIKALLPEPEIKKPVKAQEGEVKESNNNFNKSNNFNNNKDEQRTQRRPRQNYEQKDDSLREWTDDDNGGASIAEILANLNK